MAIRRRENPNKNSSLYTTIEDKIPYYQSILDHSNKERVKDGLKDINNDIKDTVGTGDYTFVDVMIIFLREGLEVLLIIMTLTTMTRKVKDHKGIQRYWWSASRFSFKYYTCSHLHCNDW